MELNYMKRREEPDTTILSAQDVQDMLYIGKNTLYRLLKDGEIKAFKINRIWKIPKESVDEYIIKNSGLI